MKGFDFSEKPIRVLVVEDESILQMDIEEAFDAQGIECMAAYAGDEALGLLMEFDFDAVLLDLSLPKVSGYEVLRRWPRGLSKLPIVVVSANVNPHEALDETEPLQEGSVNIVRYIPKPVSGESLAQVILEVIAPLKVLRQASG